MPRVKGVRNRSRFLRPVLRALPLIAAMLAASPAAAQTPPAPPVAVAPKKPLGRLEQESVDDAMKTLGQPLIDPSPEGKTIGKVFVVNEDVFSQRDWYFQLFNIFHRTTRGYILERELLLKPGDRWDQALVEESMRNLQSPPPLVIARRQVTEPELSSVVVILPIISAAPGQVDLLLVTRDIWSLRFNSNFEYQANKLVLLQTSLSENNLFGWRKYLAASFNFDQGAYYYGPQYLDPNILGTRLQFFASALFYTSRDTHQYEGNSQIASIRYPFYSLATRWAGGIDFVHQNAVARDFLGDSLRLVDLTATPATEMIPLEYRRRITTVDANVTHSSGVAVIQRIGVGYLVDARHSEVLPNFGNFADPALAPEFLNEYAPVSETKSEPYLHYMMFTPRYVVLRDLDTFELRENRQLGPQLDLQAGEGITAFGADRRALDLRAAAKYAIGPAGSYAYVEALGEARLWDGQWIDQHGLVSAYLATPEIGRFMRVVTEAQTESYRADTRRTAIILGGDTGMRGYAVGEFRGSTAVLGHVELRTRAVALWSQRFGALAFYDVGDSTGTFDQLLLRHDVGLGLRWLSIQFNSYTIRFDWAVPLNDGVVTRAGLPGRVSAGYLQVF
jgi:outer membrane protein assembly factor BamA